MRASRCVCRSTRSVRFRNASRHSLSSSEAITTAGSFDAAIDITDSYIPHRRATPPLTSIHRTRNRAPLEIKTACLSAVSEASVVERAPAGARPVFAGDAPGLRDGPPGWRNCALALRTGAHELLWPADHALLSAFNESPRPAIPTRTRKREARCSSKRPSGTKEF